MEKLLITTAELAQVLSADERTAKAWCLANGIMPINLGSKSRKHLRWNYEAVKSATCTRRDHSNAPSSSDAKPAKGSKKLLAGKSIKELMAAHAAKAAD